MTIRCGIGNTAKRRKNMTAKEISILRRINKTHVELINRYSDINERIARLDTLNNIMNDIIDLILERKENE